MFRKIAALVVLAASVQAAQATTVNVVLPTGYVASGGGLSQDVDLSSYIGDFEIVSASVSVQLADDADDPVTRTVSAYASYLDTGRYGRDRELCGGSACYDYYSLIERTRNSYNYDERETATLSVDGVAVASSVSTFSNNYFRRMISEDGCDYSGSNTLRCRSSWEREYRYVSYLNRSLAFNLSDALLQDLNSDGMMRFSIDSTLGDFNVVNASVSFTLAERAAIVPLPAGAVLLLSALAGLRLSRRRQ